jgi:translocation and assembly module TamB
MAARARRWPVRLLRGLARVLAVVLLGIVTLAAAAVIVVNLPWGRRFAVHEVNAALAPMFKGQIVIERVGRLGLDGADGLDAHVTAADGTLVLAARGASARIHPLALLRSLLHRKGDLVIEVSDVDAHSLEVNLDTDSTGTLKVQTAFDPRQPAPAAAPSQGRPLLLEFPSVALRHGWVHGQMKGAPAIDADVDGLRASLRVPPDGLAIDVSRVDLLTRGMPQGADARGRIEAHLVMPSNSGAALGVNGAYDGDVGGIPTTVNVSLDGDRLDAVVDVRDADPGPVHALAPSVTPQQAVRAHVEAHGVFAALAVTAHLATGQSTIDARGQMAVTGAPSASVHLDATHVDLGAVLPTAPRSDLTVSVDVRARSTDGLYCGEYVIAIAPGIVGSQSVPAATLRGDFEQLKRGLRVDTATSLIALPPDLGLQGHAALHASATVTLAEPPTLEASAHAVVEGLDRPGLHADAARLDARASGRLDDPQLDTTLQASGLRVAGRVFPQASAAIAGTPSRAMVAASLAGEPGASSLQARATVDVAGPLRVEDADIDLRRGPRALHAHVDRMRVAGGDVDVEGALVEGVGSPTRATVRLRPGSLTVQSDSNGIDLGTLGYVLGDESALRKGRVSYVVDITARPNGLSGTAVVDLDNACFLGVDGLTGHVDTRMSGRAVRGAVQLRADGIGTIHVDPMNIELAGNEPLALASWRRASGEVTLTGEIDLAKLIDVLPPDASPLAGASGKLRVTGHIERKAASDALPDVTLGLETSGLVFETRGAPDVSNGRTVVVAAPKTTESGIDVSLNLEANGPANSGSIKASLFDSNGAIVSIVASSAAIPYAELASAPARFGERMLRVPFTARVAMPSRSLDRMPGALRLDGATGTADLTVAVDGTALDPRVTLQGGIHSLRLVGSRTTGPIEAEVTGKYDGSVADATVRVTRAAVTGPAGELLRAVAHGNARIAEILERGDATWEGSASAKLAEFPLAMIPALSDRRVHGTASGELELTGLHRDARAKLDLHVTDLRVGKQTYGQLHLASRYDGRALDADMHFDQGQGKADAKANLALRWGAALVPSPDPAGASHASLTARKLRLGFVAPFIQSAADAFDGSLDADARVSLEPGKKPVMSGTMALSDGVVGLVSLGQELHAVTGHVVFAPDGVVRLQDASASATAGKVTAVGVARLDGTSLVGAEVDLQILKRDAMPLDVEGSDLGAVYGKFVVKLATSADRATTVSVDVPSLNVRLPDASTHTVQDLGDSPGSDHIGTFATPGRFVTLSMDGHQVAQATGNEAAVPPLVVNVHVGDAQVARGTDVRVDLTGNLTARVEKKTTMTGQITIRSGRLDVQGKSFEIESGGTATFTSDPSNPEIKVTAGWTAEDGTRVLADYVGPLKTGKVTLRSEPARPQNEIVALIAFGTADGSESTPYQSSSPTDPGVQAGTTVGGFATSGLSKGLDKLTGLDITAKIDTSQPNPRPEVEVQVARNISLELSVVLGTPPPGTNEDTTYATVDWRFHKHWSLATTFGNMGSSIADVLWRRRY